MPVVNVKYVEDRKSFGEFMVSRQAGEPVEKAANDVMAIAITGTPFNAKDEGPHMRDRFKVVRAIDWISKKNKNPRITYDVINDDPGSPAIEFGFGRAKRARTKKGYRMLGRAGAKIGQMRDERG